MNRPVPFLLVLSSLLLATGCSSGTGLDDSRPNGGKADGEGASETAVTNFECVTTREEDDGTATIHFSVKGLDTGKIDLVWPADDETSPIDVKPDSSRTNFLETGIWNGYVQHIGDGDFRMWSDDDGIEFGTVILYSNSGFRKGYVRYESGLGDIGFYSPLKCTLTAGIEEPVASVVSFDVPLVLDQGVPFASLNAQLKAAGYDEAPAAYRITADQAGVNDAEDAIVKWAGVASALKIEEPTWADFGDDANPVCFTGNAADVSEALYTLAGPVFSEMLIPTVTRSKDGLVYDSHEFESEQELNDAVGQWLNADDLAAWNAFDGADGSVAVLSTADDSGTAFFLTVLQPCAK